MCISRQKKGEYVCEGRFVEVGTVMKWFESLEGMIWFQEVSRRENEQSRLYCLEISRTRDSTFYYWLLYTCVWTTLLRGSCSCFTFNNNCTAVRWPSELIGSKESLCHPSSPWIFKLAGLAEARICQGYLTRCEWVLVALGGIEGWFSASLFS